MLGDERTEARAPQPIGCHCLKDLQCWYPDKRDPPEADTFEIGLVLAGAVSAGAYTAGVMDFLFEALDEWYRYRKEDKKLPKHKRKLPQHNVVLRVISGASAGGINGAIAAAACRYNFPTITLGNAEERGSENPFFSTWVKGIDISHLLDPSDIKRGKPVRSILNSECLDELANEIVGLSGPCVSPGQRGWLADPFKLLLTVTNLQGVPYEVRFSGGTGFGHEMMMHRDHMGFSVSVSDDSGQAPAPAPDLVPLRKSNNAKNPAWKLLAKTALASGAFPFALATQILSRPGSDYDYRYIFPYAPTGLVYSQPRIKTNELYDFAAVDGGTMNNEPFELAHRELAGLRGHNPRSGKAANRAVIMVDPFTDRQEEPSDPDRSLLGTFLALFPALVAQTRFKQIDLTLAEAGDVYSRFLIAPRRFDCGGRKFVGSKAIASSRLSGFLGFFCEAYRMHDYMLGRQNCQHFLRDWFVLPSTQTNEGQCLSGDNPLFKKWPQAALSNTNFKNKSRHRKDHRQIIPLVGTAAKCQTLAEWPSGKFNGYDQFRQQIENRVHKLGGPIADAISRAYYKETEGISRWLLRNALWLVWHLRLKRRIRRQLKQWIDDAGDKINNQ